MRSTFLGKTGSRVFSQVGHPRLGHEPELVVRCEGQLGALPGGPLSPGLARTLVEDVRLAARLVLLRLRLRAHAKNTHGGSAWNVGGGKTGVG